MLGATEGAPGLCQGQFSSMAMAPPSGGSDQGGHGGWPWFTSVLSHLSLQGTCPREIAPSLLLTKLQLWGPQVVSVGATLSAPIAGICGRWFPPARGCPGQSFPAATPHLCSAAPRSPGPLSSDFPGCPTLASSTGKVEGLCGEGLASEGQACLNACPPAGTRAYGGFK